MGIELRKDFDHINNKSNQRQKALETLEKAKKLEVLKNEFRSIFKVGINQFLDNIIIASTGKIVIDILLFEKFISKEYGIFENESLNNSVKRHFGKKGILMLEKVLL